MAAIDGDLLERLKSDLRRAGDWQQLVCSVATRSRRIRQARTPQRAGSDLLGEIAQRWASVEATVRLVPTGLI